MARQKLARIMHLRTFLSLLITVIKQKGEAVSNFDPKSESASVMFREVCWGNQAPKLITPFGKFHKHR